METSPPDPLQLLTSVVVFVETKLAEIELEAEQSPIVTPRYFGLIEGKKAAYNEIKKMIVPYGSTL